jgi:oligopeptide/dipeptide ABC transporter ATP-binding protein
VMYAGRVVEKADLDYIFSDPTHPYTVGLLNSLPRLGQDRLTPIPGAPPNMMVPPSGCAFRPRCEFAEPECAVQIPELERHHESFTACLRISQLSLAVAK